jgi:hypothetical protein
LVIEAPKDYLIDIKSRNIADPLIEDSLSFKRFKWETSFDPDLEYEIYSPSLHTLLPNVKALPVKFLYGVKGDQSSWKAFGNWVFRLNSGLDQLPAGEQMTINRLIKDATTDYEKLKILYTYLQDNTRYINVSIDIGGLRSYPASYVCENKYGDCKALSNYMKSVLAYAGINSYYALIEAGETIETLDKDFPSSQFNHMILFVPLKNDTIWLECTNKYIPPGYLGTSTQNREALIIKAHNSELIKTPSLTIDESKVSRYAEFEETEGKIKINLNYMLRAGFYEWSLNYLLYADNTEKERNIHKLIPFSDYELIDHKLRENEDASANLNLTIRLNKGFESYENIKYTALLKIGVPNFERPGKRKNPVKINYPIYISDSLIYLTPGSFKPKSLNDTIIETKYGKYRFNANIRNDRICIKKEFILYAGDYSNAEYADFYDFIKTVNTIERKNPIVFEKN